MGVGAGDMGGLGLAGAEHGLLGAVVQRPDSGGVVLTGRLSMVAQPWLTDHAVAGVVLFPGAGFVELVLRAGDEVGCTVVEELTLSAPLLLPAADGVHVQVVVGAAASSGSRTVSVYSLGAQPGSEWVLHAEGVLGAGTVQPPADMSVWPPVGATAVDVTDAYERLAERGYEYGPAFQGLQAMWQRGNEVFAEVAVPEVAGVEVDGFGIHPVLVDAALHAMGVAGAGPDCTGGCGGGVGGLGRWSGSAGLIGTRVGGSPSLGGAVVDASSGSSGRRGAIRGDMVAGVVGVQWYWR
jgi:acyl transferase domain-containing protein